MEYKKFLLLTSFIFFAIECQSIIEDNAKNPDDDDIDISQAPFALSLQLNGQHICGATIIDENWGITTAHCLTIDSTGNYSVRSGSTFRESGGTIHNLIKIIRHEKYNRTNLDYDIAVFMIDPLFHYNSLTQPIKLPMDSVAKDRGIVVGWGAFVTFHERILSERLRRVTLPLIDRQECAEDYEGTFDVTPRQLCYGYRAGGVDTCKGDSGGPLFNLDQVLIGLTSWGDGCAQRNSPGVYTNVQMMSEWVQQRIDI